MMLPDGLHKRDDDWTIFFLNRPKIEAPVSLAASSSSAAPPASTSSPSTEPKEAKEKPADPEPKTIEAFLYELKADDENAEAEPSWQLVGKTKKLVYLLPNALQVKDKDGTLVTTMYVASCGACCRPNHPPEIRIPRWNCPNSKNGSFVY